LREDDLLEATHESQPAVPTATRAGFCRRHRIRRLSLFGSVLEGTARPDSDIDLLVECEPGGEPGLIALAGMENDLSALLGGRRVDLQTSDDLSQHFRDDALRTAEVQHACE
jgi:predicted nucleotidyltransferase